MSEIVELDPDGIEQVSLKQYTEKAYLDYSMYVILDRACPMSATASSRYSGASCMP